MSVKINDEMVVEACKAAYGPLWSFFDVVMVRAALEAALPLIMEEAAQVVDDWDERPGSGFDHYNATAGAFWAAERISAIFRATKGAAQ